jgi:SAM-dependent methyltransferase
MIFMVKQVLKHLVSPSVYRPILTWWSSLPPVRWSRLRRFTLVSRVFGLDRGQPIDRYYIEAFLQRHSGDIRGRVLEIGDPFYTNKFGRENVTKSDVLHAVAGNPQVTLVGDLTTGQGIPRNTFDCLILTQTLLVIYDVHAAAANCYTALNPGGVLLATVPGISQISRYDMDRWGDFWRFTDASARRLFEDIFGPENVTVVTYGNVRAACAFLQGMAAHELKRKELEVHDPDYQVTIGVRAVKRGNA